jgi:hypothetical protein
LDYKQEKCPKTGSCTNEILETIIRPYKLDRQRNPDISNRLKVDNLVEVIKFYQMNWLDHLQRMDRSHLPKLTLHYKPQGRWDTGIPRLRWRDQEHLEL